jgi:hypothetical protein
VIGVSRMPHPEEEAENQEGHDVQGGSGHCACFKMTIPAELCCISPNANSRTPTAAFFDNGELQMKKVLARVSVHRRSNTASFTTTLVFT